MSITDRAIPFCGVDGAQMELTEGRRCFYYRCKRYFRENRRPQEKPCTNRLYLQEWAQIEKELKQLDEEGRFFDGATGTVGYVSYRVGTANAYYTPVYVQRR